MERKASILAKLDESLKSAALTDADSGAIALARRYAELLDDVYGDDTEYKAFNELGPKLNALLNDLGLTPRGRRMPKKTSGEVTPDDSPRAKLLLLRGERGPNSRKHIG